VQLYYLFWAARPAKSNIFLHSSGPILSGFPREISYFRVHFPSFVQISSWAFDDSETLKGLCRPQFGPASGEGV